MFKSLKRKFWDIYNEVQFHFGGSRILFAVLLNPFFFIRKGLFYNITKLAPKLHGRVLDFGCGAKPYRKFFTECSEYIGCDVEVSGHSHINENIDVYYDGKHLPFDDNSFDGIFSSEVFEHIFNLEEMLMELRRVIKKGGVMLVTLPFVWNEHERPYDFARYTSFGIKDLLERNGFEIVELHKSNTYCEVIFQMWIGYFRSSWEHFTTNIYMKLLFQVFVLCPMTVSGLVLSVILPKNDTLFNNIIVLCRKK